MDRESLQVDLADRDDVRAKLPEARLILERKEAALREHSEDVESWRGLVGLLAVRAGVESASDQPAKIPPWTGESASNGSGAHLDLVVSVVEREARPIRSRDVADILRREGTDIENDAVSNALYYAAIRADPPRITKLSARGFYAPLGFKETTPSPRVTVSEFSAPDRLAARDKDDP